MERVTMSIDGMSCGHCVASVNKALKALEGVEVEQVAIGKASFTYDPTVTSTDAITDALADEGYAVASTESSAAN